MTYYELMNKVRDENYLAGVLVNTAFYKKSWNRQHQFLYVAFLLVTYFQAMQIYTGQNRGKIQLFFLLLFLIYVFFIPKRQYAYKNKEVINVTKIFLLQEMDIVLDFDIYKDYKSFDKLIEYLDRNLNVKDGPSLFFYDNYDVAILKTAIRSLKADFLRVQKLTEYELGFLNILHHEMKQNGINTEWKIKRDIENIYPEITVQRKLDILDNLYKVN